ncbi:SPFH domain / Band 7 family protein [Chryseolinea serpens]|uniref:SPFH domain / Band 7 family protein n=1 Tax=Chryseolinea serpens TaxID=947013 RepID=A0A1M5XF16_9BACT|nr:slipin family protein [Chryseolinea serpens]SHH97803.1 SPFH domain / Band 7 family protein [Chryseolinea serpens]
MKRIRINTGYIGLVFKNGNYKNVLTEGAYWLSFSETVMFYDMTKPFHPSLELNILLRDQALADLLTVVEVMDAEIALHYENGNFKSVLIPGRYAFWKGVVDYTFVKADLSKIEITEDININTLMRKEVQPYIRVFAVESYEKGILLIDGKLTKVLETGVYFFWKNAVVVTVLKADLRQLQMEVSGQEILTRDKAGLRLSFFAQYKVVDILKALIENKDFEKQLYVIIQLCLREFVGTLSLDELLEKKESIGAYMLESLKDKAAALGIEVRDCGVKDIILPGEMKEIMNQVLVAQKKAEANVIMRREETASTRSLLNTAKLMEENSMLFKLKEMEYVEKIADKINTISLSGGNQVIDQLKDIFVPRK